MKILMELNFVGVDVFGQNFKASWRGFCADLDARFHKKRVGINMRKDEIK